MEDFAEYESIHVYPVYAIGHRTEYVCQWKILLNMRVFMYILYMQSADW